jgi:integrase
MANPAVIPISISKGRPIRTKRGRMVILSSQEMLALLKAAKNRSTRDWAMILLAYRHGLRASEVCGIKLGDVDLKAGSLSIRRLKNSLHTVQPIYQHRGQPLLDEMAALRAWLRNRPEDGSDYLFVSQKGGKLGRPPYSMTQAKECYEGRGMELLDTKPTSMEYWSDCKNEIMRAVEPGGKVICFGWNTMGMGINRGFEMQRILIVPHGGSRNDTLVTVELKT